MKARTSTRLKPMRRARTTKVVNDLENERRGDGGWRGRGKAWREGRWKGLEERELTAGRWFGSMKRTERPAAFKGTTIRNQLRFVRGHLRRIFTHALQPPDPPPVHRAPGPCLSPAPPLPPPAFHMPPPCSTVQHKLRYTHTQTNTHINTRAGTHTRA